MENYNINKIYFVKNIQMTFYSFLLSIITMFIIVKIFDHEIILAIAITISFLPIIFIIPAIIYDRQYSSIDMFFNENTVNFIKKNKIILTVLLNEIIKIQEIEISISRIFRSSGGYKWYQLRFYYSKKKYFDIGKIPINEYENIDNMLSKYNLKIDRIKSKDKIFY